jgi:transcriptional regulator with XRE-family HTH domain
MPVGRQDTKQVGGAVAGIQPSAFGTQLRGYREAAGLSQEELAERARLTASAIGALERGERRRPYPHTVQVLATALDLDEARRAAFIAAVPRRGAGTGLTRTRPPDPRTQGTTTTASPGANGFVGRSDELARLQAALDDATVGRGKVVMVVGEAGIGKTRLAREFARAAREAGATVLWGRCFEGDWQPPYGPWVEAIRDYTEERNPDTLLQHLGPGAAAIARLLPEIRAGLPDLPIPSQLSPDDERYRLYDAIVQLLIAVSATGPLVVVIDDLHWADADSLRVLQHVGQFVGREHIVVVGAYRDPDVGLTDEHPLVATLAGLRREGEYQRVGLEGFSGEEVDTYLAQMAGQALPQSLVKAIDEETSGNPFYAREVFRHLTEEAKVLRRDGRWSTDLSIRELGIPEGVREVVRHRIARLSHETGDVLGLAAGFSGSFGFDVLEALSGLQEDTLLDCLDEALRAGLIRTFGETPPRYTFAHAIVRHTLYERLNFDRRARLHRRIAVALEQVFGGHELEHAAELATQYHMSATIPDAGRGTRYALAVARQAKAAFAHERAAAFLRIARDLATDGTPLEQADILRRLAVAEAEAVRLDEARNVGVEALEAMRSAGTEPRARAEFLATLARALKDGGAGTAVWEPLVERGLALAGNVRDLTWARLALLRDRFESVQSGPISGGEWRGQDAEAVAVARTEGDEGDYAQTLEPLEWRTRAETNAILVLAGTWSQPIAVMRALDAAGRDLMYRHGAFHDALPVYEELLAVSERVGSIPGQAEALSHVATAHVALGDLTTARDNALRAYNVIARLGPEHRLHFVASGLAFILAYFLEGEWPVLGDGFARYTTSADTARMPPP